MFLILTSSSVFAATGIPERQSSVDTSFWPSFITAAAPPQLQSLGTAQSFAAAAPHSAGYVLNTPLGGSPSRLYPSKNKEQQEAMAQNILVSAYPAPYTYLHRPSQQQQGNYISYSQLIPSFQTLNLGGISFDRSYQPRFTTLPSNYTRGLNVSASQSVPATEFFPGVHSSYFPSAVGVSPSWPALTLSALQPSSNNGVGGFSATPLYQSATNTASLNSLAPLTLDSIYKNQRGLNTDYLTFPLTAYNQDYAQLVLSQPKQKPYEQVRGNKQKVNMAAPAGEHKTSAREPSAKGRYQYSSKYSKPLPDSEDKEPYTRNSPQDLDDSYDSEGSSKSSDSYKNSDSSRHSNNEDDDKDDGDYRNSYDFAENTKRPQYTPPSNDDDSEESSDFHSRSCNSFKSSPSKEASSHSNTFSDVHYDFGPPNFEDQFKAFATNGNFKVPDFTAESSKTVTDYYKNPASSSEKRLKMMYSQHSKVTDSYMTPTEQRVSETPKTLHYYHYKPPAYSYDSPVEYFPSSSFKSSSEESTTHPTTSQPYDDRDDRDDRDSVDHDSSTITVTRTNKMYT
jgi:hypothetical protein